MGNNFSVPYSGFIPGGVTDSIDVVICGRTHPSFKSFSINLCTGPNLDHDVAFHFNPRSSQGNVVRNHKQGGAWGNEETYGDMPFRPGHNFELHLKVDFNCFKVTINGRHFCDFQHRIPKERIQYLYIVGDVTITYIQFRGQTYTGTDYGQPGYPAGSVAPPAYPGGPACPPSYPGGPGFPSMPNQPGFPSGGPSYNPMPNQPGFPGSSGPIFNPGVPFATPIPGGLYPGKIIYLAGVPNQGASRFSINLQCGPYESGDIGITFDVRFNFGNSQNVVVRNHKQNGTWGNEERHQSFFPFFPGQNFEIMILTEPNCFKIAVNNQHFTEFTHRIQPFSRLDHLTVTGNVQLTQVRFQ